jgi:Protein of unknown function (DUF3631)
MRNFCETNPRPTRAGFLRHAFAPRRGVYPWHEPGWKEPTVSIETTAPATVAAPEPVAADLAAQERAEARAQRAREREVAAAERDGIRLRAGLLPLNRTPQGRSIPERAAEIRARVEAGRAEYQDQRAGIPAAASQPGPGTIALRLPQVITRRHPDIDGAEVLRFARAYLTRFGYWPSQAAVTAATLWPAHAHARDAGGTLVWDATPRLYLLSEEPGSGKSTLLELVGRLCPAVFGLDVEPSEAGLAHTIGREHATVLLDEGDVLFGSGRRKAAVRAILNGGYAPNGTWLRMRSGTGERVAVFGAAAVAALDVMEKATGDSLTALMQRGIKIRVRRCPDEVSLPRLGRREAAAAGQISAMLAAWTADRLPDLQDAAETVQAPAGVRNRAEQIWRPLLAVAEVAGGEWPDLAAEACADLALSAPAECEPPAGDDLDGLRDLVASWA